MRPPQRLPHVLVLIGVTIIAGAIPSVLPAQTSQRAPDDSEVTLAVRRSPELLVDVEGRMCSPRDSAPGDKGINSIRVLRRAPPGRNEWPVEVEIEGRCTQGRRWMKYLQVARFRVWHDEFGDLSARRTVGPDSLVLVPTAPPSYATVPPAVATPSAPPTANAMGAESVTSLPTYGDPDTVSTPCAGHERCFESGAFQIELTRVNATVTPPSRDLEIIAKIRNTSNRRVMLSYVPGSVLAVDEDAVRYTPKAAIEESRCIAAASGPAAGPPLGIDAGQSQDVVFRVRGAAGQRPSSVFTVQFAILKIDVSSGRPESGRPLLYRYSGVTLPRGLRALVDLRTGCIRQ